MNQTVKPELKSPEMKAKYFYLHYGQPVFNCLGLEKIQEKPQHSILQSDYLELTSLDQITDEDAIEVGRLHGHEDEENLWTDEYLLYVGKRVTGYFPNYTTPVPVKDLIRITDFLRSRGYALPWNGHSVQELIEAGYMKLREGGEKK